MFNTCADSNYQLIKKNSTKRKVLFGKVTAGKRKNLKKKNKVTIGVRDAEIDKY